MRTNERDYAHSKHKRDQDATQQDTFSWLVQTPPHIWHQNPMVGLIIMIIIMIMIIIIMMILVMIIIMITIIMNYNNDNDNNDNGNDNNTQAHKSHMSVFKKKVGSNSSRPKRKSRIIGTRYSTASAETTPYCGLPARGWPVHVEPVVS